MKKTNKNVKAGEKQSHSQHSSNMVSFVLVCYDSVQFNGIDFDYKSVFVIISGNNC